MDWFFIILVALAIGIVVYFIGQYNKLVRLRTTVQESWQQIDVELNRRYDLIPNLVATVKGHAGFERSTLENVVKLRNQAAALAKSGNITERAAAEQQLQQAVSNMFVTVEAYPDLKSNVQFTQLMNMLTETEDRIANGRKYYNANVANYNQAIATFPTSFIASRYRFEPAAYFEIQDLQMRQRVDVNFDDLSAGSSMKPTTAQQPTPPLAPQPEPPGLSAPQQYQPQGGQAGQYPGQYPVQGYQPPVAQPPASAPTYQNPPTPQRPGGYQPPQV